MLEIEERNVEEVNSTKPSDIIYNADKDFYKGMGGELRFKAEGLFKKAKEKGISIEDIDICPAKENQAEFPGIGSVDLPAFIIKVRGRDIKSGQVVVDGKQIDYYNIYQSYVADRIEDKNIVRDEKGRTIREDSRPKIRHETELFLTEWERFEIGKKIVEDKEFGLEKTITGACDRVIRKLMGENDWLSQGEARQLEEEFNNVQQRIADERRKRASGAEGGLDVRASGAAKKATERQINYLKARIKNAGADPDNEMLMREVIKQSGFDADDIGNLSTGEMSKIIDSVNIIIPKAKEALLKQKAPGNYNN